MSEEGGENPEEQKAEDKSALARKLDAGAWALFFIWLGIALMTKIGFGYGMLGVGVITLGAQVVRKGCGLRLESFWIVVGLLLVVGGLWEVWDVTLPFVPILLVVAGLAILASAIAGKHRMCCK